MSGIKPIKYPYLSTMKRNNRKNDNTGLNTPGVVFLLFLLTIIMIGEVLQITNPYPGMDWNFAVDVLAGALIIWLILIVALINKIRKDSKFKKRLYSK